MLVISRSELEPFTMTVPPSDTPTVIEVMLTECRGQCKVGIKAPKEVNIARHDAVKHTRRKGEPCKPN